MVCLTCGGIQYQSVASSQAPDRGSLPPGKKSQKNKNLKKVKMIKLQSFLSRKVYAVELSKNP